MRLNRRDLILGVTSIGLLTAISKLSVACASASSARRFDHAVVEAGVNEAELFGARLATRKIPTETLPSGEARHVERLWIERLGPRLREESQMLVGMTSPQVLFGLELLCAQHWHHTVFAVEHVEDSQLGLRHFIPARLAGNRLTRMPSSLQASWPQAWADFLLEMPGSLSGMASGAGISRSDDHGRRLITWIIAPMRTTRTEVSA